MGVIRILFLADTHLGYDFPFRPRIALARCSGLICHAGSRVDLPSIGWALIKLEADQLTSPET